MKKITKGEEMKVETTTNKGEEMKVETNFFNVENFVEDVTNLSKNISSLIEELVLMEVGTTVEIKKYLINIGRINPKLEITKKLILKEYLFYILLKIETQQKSLKSDKITLKIFNGIIREVKSLIDCSDYLIDFTFNKRDNFTNRLNLIKLSNQITKKSNHFSDKFDVIEKVTFSDDGYNITHKKLFSKSDLKDLNNKKDDDGTPTFLASELIDFLKKEIESNLINNQSLMSIAKNEFYDAKKVLTA